MIAIAWSMMSMSASLSREAPDRQDRYCEHAQQLHIFIKSRRGLALFLT